MKDSTIDKYMRNSDELLAIYNKRLSAKLSTLQEMQRKQLFDALKFAETNNLTTNQIKTIVAQTLADVKLQIPLIVNSTDLAQSDIIDTIQSYRVNKGLPLFDDNRLKNIISSNRKKSNRKLVNFLNGYNDNKIVSATSLIDSAEFSGAKLSKKESLIFSKYEFNQNSLLRLSELKVDSDLVGSQNELSKTIDKEFVYYGPEDSDNRGFCETWVGIVQTKEFWDDIGDLVWAGKIEGVGTIWIYAGGWNCRHTLIAVE